jgi:hypothetical protein
MARPTDPTQGYGAAGFSTASLADGWTGLASNAGGGMKSMWGRLSTNATAAFSAVQDATKDFRPAIQGGGVFTGYTSGSAGGSGSGSHANRSGSALGWGNNDAWSISPASALNPTSAPSWTNPLTLDTGSAPATIRPKPQVGVLRGDSLSSNPWSTPASPSASSTTGKVRSLEDEWKSSTLSRTPALNLPSQTTLGPPLQNATIYAAPTPRHASSLSPPPAADRRATPQQKGAEIKVDIDPLGVGPL